MKHYIIKASGSFSDVINGLNALQAIFGKNATLSDVEKIIKYSNLLQEEKETREKLKEILKRW